MMPQHGAGARFSKPSTLSGLLGSGFLGLVLLSVLLLLSPINTPELGRDEGVFVYIGRGILQGLIPYRDLWDHKGPLIYYINALGLWIFPTGLWGIWLIEAIMIGCSLVLLYWLLRRTLSGASATFGILAWVAGFAIVMGGNIVEEYAILPAVLCLYLAMHQPRTAALLCGVLAAAAFMLRPNEVAAPAVALGFIMSDRDGLRGWATAWRGLLQFALGFGLAMTGVFAYFFSKHALGDFVSSVFLFNYYYISEKGSVLAGLLSGMAYLIVPMLFSLTGLVWAFFLEKSRFSSAQNKLLYFAMGLFFLTVPLSLLSGRAYRHYYISWLLPVCLLNAYFLFFLERSQIAPRLKNLLWILAWAVLATGAMVGIRIRAAPLFRATAPSDQANATRSIQDFVPGNQVMLIWGNETAYAITADRMLVGRYLYLIPILTPGYGEGAADELLEDIRAKHPIIIDASPTDPGVPSLDSETPPLAYLSSLYEFIHKNYRIIGTVAEKNWVVWGPQ